MLPIYLDNQQKTKKSFQKKEIIFPYEVTTEFSHIQPIFNQFIVKIFDKMKKGHKRTESENILHFNSKPKLKIQMANESSHHRILSLIQANNQGIKQKTVFVETLQVQKPRSHHYDMFIFGRKDGQSSTVTNSPYSQHLISIPEKKPMSYHSLKKGIKKPSSHRSLIKKQQQGKNNSSINSPKKNPYILTSKKSNKNKKTLKNSKNQKEKVKDHGKKKNDTPHLKKKLKKKLK